MQKFELTVLGSGSALPTNNRNPSAQLLNIAERFFLIDCGEGTQVQLRKYKASFRKIDYILISHLHGDHYFGLIGLLQSFHLLGRKKKLKLFCPVELKNIIEIQNKASQTDLNFDVEYHFTNPDAFELIFEDNKVEVFSFPLKHRIPCTGFLFREKKWPRKIIKEKLIENNISISEIHKIKSGLDPLNEHGMVVPIDELTVDSPSPRSFAYCSDTVYDEELIQYVCGVDLLYHESTFLNDMQDRAKKTMHSTASEAGIIAQKSSVKTLLIGHFSSRYTDDAKFLEEVKPVFSNSLLATEGKVYSV